LSIFVNQKKMIVNRGIIFPKKINLKK